MSLRATTQVTIAGVTLSTTGVSGGAGDTFTPGDTTFLVVANVGGVDTVATIVTPRTSIGGTAIADLPVTIAAGTFELIGPFPPEHFADPTTGLATVTWSVTASVAFAVFTI